MSKQAYSNAPEVIASDGLEAVPATFDRAASRTQIRRLGDMKASSFWLLLGLICAFVIAVTVGGAVGGSIAASKSHHTETITQSMSTSTVTTHSLSASPSPSPLPSTPTTTPIPTSDCPGTNGTIYSSLFLNADSGPVPPSAGLMFTKVCGTEQYGFNLAEAYVLTFNACIELCASLNFANQDKNCLGVAFTPKGTMPGNCWAHNVTTARNYADYDSAVLIT